MSHNSRLKSDAYYVDGVVPDATWWAGIDAAQYAAINGDAGGTWNPTTLIVWTGEVWCAGPWQANLSSALFTPPGSGARITHADSDYTVLKAGHTGSTRVLVTGFGSAIDISGGTGLFTFDVSTNSMSDGVAGATFVPGARALLPLRVHDRATFSQVTFYLYVNGVHAQLPANMPQVRVFRVDGNGQVTALRTAAGTLPGGYVSWPTPGGGVGAWTGLQSFTYTLDAGVVIDTEGSTYFAEVVDESGTGAVSGNYFYAAACTFTGIPDMRPD